MSPTIANLSPSKLLDGHLVQCSSELGKRTSAPSVGFKKNVDALSSFLSATPSFTSLLFNPSNNPFVLIGFANLSVCELGGVFR